MVSSRIAHRVLGCVALLLGTALCRSQTPPPSPSPGVTTIRAFSRTVLLDVVVTDGKGHSVKGLQPSDFTVLEDDGPQTISSFVEHAPTDPSVAGKLQNAGVMPANRFSDYSPDRYQGAWTVLLIDALYTATRDQMYVHQQIVDYMKTVPAGSKIAIFRLDSSLHLVQGFSDDPKLLLAAAQNNNRDKVVLPPLTGPYYKEREALHKDAMRTIGRYLSAYPGRKNLIWFTGSLPSENFEKRLANPFPSESSFLDDEGQTTAVLSLSRVALYPVDARGLTPHPVYTGPYLDELAVATGGKAFYSTNGLKEAITEVLDTGSHFYTLSYTPTNDNWDDGYRKIRIELSRPGYTLEYRHSYYARSDAPKIEKHLARTPIGRVNRPADDSKPRTPKSIVDAMQLGAVAPTDVLFFTDVTAGSGTHKPQADSQLDSDRFLREAYRKKAYRNYLVRYSASPHDLKFAQSSDGRYHASVEYIATVFTDDGAVVNALQSTANLDLDPAQYAQAQRDWIGVPLTIAVPTKGTYYLRMGVHDVASNHAGVVEVPLSEIHPGPPGNGIAVP